MQKWEYCVVGPIGIGMDLQPKAEDARITFLTDGGRTGGYQKNSDEVAKLIAGLGDQGWELVGCGNISAVSHFLYFKRPLS